MFIGPYAEAMAHGCQARFVVERERDGGVLLTGRGIQETNLRVKACDQVVSTVLDCDMPWRGLGWSCHAHSLPMPAGAHDHRELTAELVALYGAMSVAGCGDNESASFSDRVERTSYTLVGTQPSVLRSLWTATGCGRRWTAESRCVRAGLDWDGEGVCTLVRFDEVVLPVPAAAAPPPAPASSPAELEVPAGTGVAAPAPRSALGGIAVVVTDREEVPLPGAGVQLDSPSLRGASRTGVTGPKGEFVLRELPPGTYAVRVEREGFATVVQTQLDVRAGRLVRVELSLSWRGR